MTNKKTVIKNSVATLAALSAMFAAPTVHAPSLQKSKGLAQLARNVASAFAYPKAYASAPLHTNLLNGLRGAIGTMVGFSSTNAYVELVCNGNAPAAGQSCDGPPQVGIVGAIAELINQLPRIAGSAGITSCETAPDSGTRTGRDAAGNSVTLTFSAPSQAIPTGWVNSQATFAHRVKFAASLTNIGPDAVPITIAYEFNCGDSSASYAAISMPMDNVAHYQRDIGLYMGAVSDSVGGVELAYAEHEVGVAAHVRSANTMRIHFNPTTHDVKIWGLLSNGLDFNTGSGGVQLVSRVILDGDYVTGKARVFAQVVGNKFDMSNDGELDVLGINALPSGQRNDASVTAGGTQDMHTDLDSHVLRTGPVPGTPGVAGTPVVQFREACVDFNSPLADNAPGHASCAAFTPVAASGAPAFDASGSWTVAWGLKVGDHLENLL